MWTKAAKKSWVAQIDTSLGKNRNLRRKVFYIGKYSELKHEIMPVIVNNEELDVVSQASNIELEEDTDEEEEVESLSASLVLQVVKEEADGTQSIKVDI